MVENKTWAFNCLDCCTNGLPYPMTIVQGANAVGILKDTELGISFFCLLAR